MSYIQAFIAEVIFMSEKKLHPSVQKFKEFVKNHPGMVLQVREGKTTWQDLFEEWYLLGEEDARWEEFTDVEKSVAKDEKEEGKKDWVPQVMNVIKNMDANQLQGHIASLSQALGAIQGLITQFQKGNQSPAQSTNPTNQPQHPFQFRKD